ncbi:uncharacterized protein LOC18430887 [Amborella trichopoda]|uniref:Uncharacterized protein n=1 Tax=Amborella trichopoda TaxID=13333 RepID=W1NYU4_AMBTC|nr:uncharacterized protein LOC18430887 [Amborella trichopoda]XP_020520942.1 uncharacterized protein LOC18430887 [Amborella trichopoda]XP_020520943.1 uncharacterized protein LOC18430887 [Amborella trichopoda]XP_020520944.1 uncharacterized protein LOC18430887 [Amborella trichopoda]ERN02767.1 hypothetical protein AMTR_s00086p00057290 [Amborella trichopoda]|eukprot:XP_006841092.1 uncharacterized protein LOC18430887 [Amborella trichopoda]
MGVSRSSSDEEDGDAEWRAGIESVANGFNPISANYSRNPPKSSDKLLPEFSLDEENKRDTGKSPGLKLYQVKAQNLLHDFLDKNLVMVRDPIPPREGNNVANEEDGVRLFSRAPCGITFETVDATPVKRKRPRILPTESINEKSKKFVRKLRSVVVDGEDIIAAAEVAHQRSLDRFVEREAATKAATKREEERVAALKSLRGERWLPSLAKEMQRS